jgi:hypothetical protein
MFLRLVNQKNQQDFYSIYLVTKKKDFYYEDLSILKKTSILKFKGFRFTAFQ